ncbi:MAG: DUF1294 domain-containing protein [Faecalibacillus sp.]
MTYYLFVINLIGFLFMAIDKYKARKHHWRISENTLLCISLIGGSLGSLMGMSCFHHKTRHSKFVLGIPIILFFQIIFYFFFNDIFIF